MATLVCFGFGYSAQHYVAEFAAGFDRVVGTVRSPEQAAALAARRHGGRAVETLVFDGPAASHELRACLDEARAVLVSIPPLESGDPVLTAFAGALPAARLETIIY